MATTEQILAINSKPPWSCAYCGKEKRPTVKQMRRTYCSVECFSLAGFVTDRARTEYFIRFDLAVELMADWFQGVPRKDTASRLGISRPRATAISNEFGVPAVERGVKLKCLHCAAEFTSSPSTNRKYCSYQCFLDSGGALRAGEAAVMAKKKYGVKKDANHDEIFEAMRIHTAVHDLSSAGFGVPDGLAWINDGWHLFDVKNPKTTYGRKGLNSRQKKWAADWRGGPVYLIYSVEEALCFVKGDLEKTKRFVPGQE